MDHTPDQSGEYVIKCAGEESLSMERVVFGEVCMVNSVFSPVVAEQ